MNTSKRKNRPVGLSRFPTDSRHTKVKYVQAQGVYNNTYFMHAATALVGNIVQVHLRSGNVYEGIFRTFSPNFDVALELPFCIKNNMNIFDEGKTVPNCMIFTSDNVVSIVAKEFDPNYATGGAFQTDNAISEKIASRVEEKELEPWDPSGINGEVDFELDIDANGWDANEMFTKNEKTFGVQSTFDDSLSDYTVQIEKTETDEFKEAEAKAEKLAQEIEKNPVCRERLDLENGDEEALFAAVERPVEVIRDDSATNNKTVLTNTTQSRNNNANCIASVGSNQQHIIFAQRNCNNIQEKSIQIPKRKTLQGSSKIVRTSGNNTCSNVLQNNSNAKLSNYQSMQISINQSYTSMQGSTYRHQSSMQQTKLNGDVPNVTLKNTPPRSIRSYSAQNNIYSPQQMSAPKAAHLSHTQNSTSSVTIQENNCSPPLHANHLGQQAANSIQAPMQQRQLRGREEQIQDLRKFQQDFHLAGVSQPAQHQITLHINKSASTTPHQMQQSLSPPQSQQNIQHTSSSIPNLSQVMSSAQIHHLNVKPTENQNVSHNSKSYAHSNQPQDKIVYPNHTQSGAKQPSSDTSPVIAMNDSGNALQTSNNGNNSSNNSFNTTSNKCNSELMPGEKVTPKTTLTKKTHVLNPSAKPFTPRSPSTPNPSRPHTPQTPVQSSGIYSSATNVGNSQTSFYLMQPQQHAHPNAVPQSRLRRGPIAASQIHVSAAAAATGQPLLTAPLQQFIHYQQPPHPPHFPSQPYQPMMRMFHDPPPQSIQFLAQTPPSTTPSPGQSHQPFHPPPQPSPAGGGPQTTFGTAAQPYHVMCPVIHPQLVPNYYHQGTQQNPHQQYGILMSQHPAQ